MIPIWYLKAFIIMMPRLQAMRSLQSAESYLAGQRTKDGKRIRDRWRGIASGRVQPGDQKDSSLSALVSMAQANAEARERGELWEQKRERGEV